MARRREAVPSVYIHGAGKLGTALARALRAAGATVTLRAARRGLPKRVEADLLVLAVRDRDLGPTASALATGCAFGRKTVVVHVAGALDASPLAPLRGRCAGVAQMHPMISFASTRFAPELSRGNVHVQGDRAAVVCARRVARLLGMTPRTVPGLDTVAYHAAAGLVANGAAALASVGATLLESAGVTPGDACAMLGPLLRSVADNVEALRFPAALTGPVRRGDAAGVEKHLATLRARLPGAVPLYLASAEAQLPLARALAEAPVAAFDALESLLAREMRGARPPRPE